MCYRKARQEMKNWREEGKHGTSQELDVFQALGMNIMLLYAFLTYVQADFPHISLCLCVCVSILEKVLNFNFRWEKIFFRARTFGWIL